MGQPFNQHTAWPDFTHKQVIELYHKDFDLSDEYFEELWELPKESLIGDLELVLQDAIDRYWFFSENNFYEAAAVGSYGRHFAIHAIFLLAELEASSSLPKILEVFAQSNDFMEFYIGDVMTENLWEPLYKLSEAQPEVLTEFMKRPGIYTWSKTTLTNAMMQLAFFQPQRRDEVVNWHGELLAFYTECSREDNIVDSWLTGIMVSNLIELQANEQIPIITKLYELDYVREDLEDELEAASIVARAINDKSYARTEPRDKLLPIAARYKKIEKAILNYGMHRANVEDDLFLADDTFDEKSDIYTQALREKGFELSNSDEFAHSSSPVSKVHKPNRNEPCPCGSGKKYKKCCLGLDD
jgi:hypothetical protein